MLVVMSPQKYFNQKEQLFAQLNIFHLTYDYKNQNPNHLKVYMVLMFAYADLTAVKHDVFFLTIL